MKKTNYRKAFPLVGIYFKDTKRGLISFHAACLFERHNSVFSAHYVDNAYVVGLEYGVPAKRLDELLAALKDAGFKPVTDVAEMKRRFRKYLEKY